MEQNPLGSNVIREINEILSFSDFGAEADIDWEKRKDELQFEIFPELMEEIYEATASESDRLMLECAEELISLDKVGVIFAPEQIDPSMGVYMLEADKSRKSLVLFFDKSTWADFRSCETRKKLLDPVKEALKTLTLAHFNLEREGTILPYSELP